MQQWLQLLPVPQRCNTNNSASAERRAPSLSSMLLMMFRNIITVRASAITMKLPEPG